MRFVVRLSIVWFASVVPPWMIVASAQSQSQSQSLSQPSTPNLRIVDSRIKESSGLAFSRTVADRFWTHNDSGDTSRLFAIDASVNGGEPKVEVVEVIGAEAIDWEDMACGRLNGQATLVVGDVGDNGKRRDSVVLYFIEEPAVGVVQVEARSIQVRYPEGPADCEAIAIDEPNERLLMMTKSWLPLAMLYEVPLKDLKQIKVGQGRAVEAKLLARLTLPMVTAMDVRDDGLELAIASYRDLFVFERAADESWETAVARIPKHAVLPKLKQIEGLCYDREGQIWVTSEGSPMPLVICEVE
jgi:hypothetical protein